MNHCSTNHLLTSRLFCNAEYINVITKIDSQWIFQWRSGYNRNTLSKSLRGHTKICCQCCTDVSTYAQSDKQNELRDIQTWKNFIVPQNWCQPYWFALPFPDSRSFQSVKVNLFHCSSILWAKPAASSATGGMPCNFSKLCLVTASHGYIPRYSLSSLQTHVLMPCPEAKLQTAL